MLSVQLPKRLEKHFWDVVQDSYKGDLQTAITAFLRLHEKYGWKEQLLRDVQSIRSEVRRKSGFKAKTIDEAIRKYRKKAGASGA
jgi:hypothetical protein